MVNLLAVLAHFHYLITKKEINVTSLLDSDVW